MTTIKHFITAMAALASIASCKKDLDSASGYGTVHLSFDLPADYSTKSSYVKEQDENEIYVYGVVIWDLSHPERCGLHIDLEGEKSRTILPSGRDYFAIGFANMGYGRFLSTYSLDPSSTSYLFKCCFSLNSPYNKSLNEGYDGITMVSTYGKKFHLDEGEDLDLRFNLERSLAKVIIQLDKSKLENSDVTVTSVSIKNCSNTFLPFYTENGPYIDISSRSYSDGDSADSQQVQEINSGKEIALYTVENLQGYRQDEAYKESHCTFVEMKAVHSLLGNITYRCYLGDGNPGNFDIRRNCIYTVTFTPTDNAGGSSCWRTQF